MTTSKFFLIFDMINTREHLSLINTREDDELDLFRRHQLEFFDRFIIHISVVFSFKVYCFTIE